MAPTPPTILDFAHDMIVLMNEADNKHYYRTFMIRRGPKTPILLNLWNERCTDVNMVFKMCAVKLYEETFW